MNKILIQILSFFLSLSVLSFNYFADSATTMLSYSDLSQLIKTDNFANNKEKHISIIPNKNNIKILPKSSKIYYKISDIWKDAFHYPKGSELEKNSFMNFYVNYIFNKYDTFVYIHEGTCISMLMVIPVSLTLSDNTIKNGYYIYAVGTKKEYRNNGITTLMLDFIDNYSKINHKDFRILNPDKNNPHLFAFYNKRGYELVRCRHIIMTPDEIQEIAQNSLPLQYHDGLSAKDLFNCRKINFEKITWFIQWAENDLEIVHREYKLGHKNYHELYFGDWQYAIINYGIDKYSTVEVKEYFIKNKNKSAFFKTLSLLFPNKSIIFEVPDNDQFSDNIGFLGKPYYSQVLTMINFKNSDDIKSKIKYPIYFNFGMD